MSNSLKSKSKILITALGVFFSSTQLNAQNNNAPQIMDFSPERYSMQNSSTVSVYVQFDVAMDDTTFLPETFLVQGEKTGFHAGTITYDSTTKTVTFEPLAPFQAGEMVTVVLTQGITNKNGKPLASSFQWSFYIQTSTGTATFELDSAYTTGKGPHFVGIGELNGDSGLDLAIPHSISHDTHTWLNMGSGIFDKNNIIGVGTQPRSLTIGDFDSDGDLDLAVPSELRNWVTIINNDGAGNFVARDTTLTVSEEPTHISNADLNGDGFLDLITVNKDSNSISVLLNLGDGNFQPQVEYPVGQVPQSSFIADFTNNGFMDIVVTNSVDSSISLLKNDSTGAFKPPENFMAGREPRAVSGQDFNGDGSLDLAVANRASNTISILFNTGGAFSQPTYYAVGTDPVAMTAGDWDGDFDADLAVTQRISNELYILLNDGSGNFQIDSIYATGLQPRNINSGDFNGDGVLDLAVVNWESNTFQVFFNTLKQNQAPGTPNLLSPDDLSFVNPDLTGLTLNWSVPNDPDNDSLHFMIEIDQSPDFTSPSLVFDSRTDVTGFTPTPPVDQSITSMSFNITEPIQDGLYWWRVFAWDGQALGIPSDARRFIVDSTPPNIDTVTVSTPDLQPNWYNQNNTAAINFEVQYDEMHAQKAEFNLGALGGVQTNESISSGLDQTVQVSVNISGVADGSYPLSVAVFDSAGNQTGDTTEIALDATPPSGAQAKSPAISAEESFSVSWGGTATDGNGSGISGFYTIRVQIDDGPWQNWLTNFEGTSAVYAGAQGHTYGFEAAAHDNLGNVEPFVGVAETATLVDTTATDVTAPDPPLTLTAGGSNPSPWQNNPEFQINWQAPPDPSGIARALFKLGDSPTADFDTTGSVTASSSTSVKATQEDGQNFYLWFEDNKGNVNFQNNAFVQLRYDKTVPAIIGINILNVDLEPNWFNQRKTQTAQVTINYSEKHLRWLLLESVDLDTTIQVEQVVSGDNISVRFDLNIQGKPDGDYALAFTLIDSAGNRKQDSTERIALDSTPPTGAEASSPQKSTTESFVVSWGGTATDGDGSGISGIYDVRVQIDGGAWENWLADFEGTSAEFQGAHGKTYGFEAAAHDNLGNVESFLEVPESVTVVDT
ncbi:MAG: FG-GAP-like repeat-containing protein, partial [bacterium]